MIKKIRKQAKNTLPIIEHRGNDQKVKNNFLMEMKIVREAPKAYYSIKGGILDI